MTSVSFQTASPAKERGWGTPRLADVVGIIMLLGIGAALMAPLLLVSREQARSRRCQSNLRAISAALGAYEQFAGVFPPAAIWSMRGYSVDDIYRPDSPFTNIYSAGPGTRADNASANWLTMLRPFVEGLRGDGSSLNDPVSVRRQWVPLFLCPTDEFAGQGNEYEWRLEDGSSSRFARGNYAINAGPNRDCPVPGDSTDPCATGYHYTFDEQDLSFQLWGDGVAGVNVSFSLRDFRRSTSELIAIEEVRAGVTHHDPRGVWALGQIGSSITFGHGAYGDASGPNSPTPHSDDIVECPSIVLAVGKPRLISERMGCCPHCRGNKQATARSMHPRGVNVLMVDGACRFIRDDIDEQVWHVLHARDNPTEPGY